MFENPHTCVVRLSLLWSSHSSTAAGKRASCMAERWRSSRQLLRFFSQSSSSWNTHQLDSSPLNVRRLTNSSSCVLRAFRMSRAILHKEWPDTSAVRWCVLWMNDVNISTTGHQAQCSHVSCSTTNRLSSVSSTAASTTMTTKQVRWQSSVCLCLSVLYLYILYVSNQTTSLDKVVPSGSLPLYFYLF